MSESKYKKSEVDFSGLNLPSKYKFRRTEWAKEPEPVATKTLDVSHAYPYDITLYTCIASISWLDKKSAAWFAAGSGALVLIKTIDVAEALPQNTATIIITNQETGRVLCREPIRRGYDFSSLQNKCPPVKKELRCVSFERATGAVMLIKFDSLEIATALWRQIKEVQKDVYLI